MSRSGPRGGPSPPPPTPTGPTAGDVTRYTAAANAYAQLRTAWGRSEAYADLTADLPGTVAPAPGHPTGRTACGPAGDGRAAPGPHLARTAPPPCPARPGHCLLSLVVVNLLPGQPSGPAVVTGLVTWFVLTGARIWRRRRGGKEDASGGVLRLGDGGHQARPPHGAGVEGLPVTSPSSRDKPSRPGQACPGRSSSRALHLDRPGPARTPDGRDDGEVTASQARKCAHAH